MKVPRLNWDQYFMLQAHLVATRATCDRGPELLFDPGRHGTGSVLVKDRMIIASGYNGSAPGFEHCDEDGHMMLDGHCIRTLHSELNAILQCAISGVSCKGAVLYTTTLPCFDCAKAVVRVGIRHVFISKLYESRYGKSESVLEFLSRAKIGVHMLSLQNMNKEKNG